MMQRFSFHRLLPITLAFIGLLAAPLAFSADTSADAPAYSNFAITLYVADVAKSVEWYENVLGFKLDHFVVGSAQEVTTLTPGGPKPYAASLVAGGQEIGLQRSSGEVYLPATGMKLHFQVADLKSLLARVTKQDVPVQHRINTASGDPLNALWSRV